MRGFLQRINDYHKSFLVRHIKKIAVVAVIAWLSVLGYSALMDYFRDMVEASVRMNLLVIDAVTHENKMKIIRIEADQEQLKQDMAVYKPTQVSGMSRTQMIVKAYTCIDDDKRPGDPAYCVTKDGTLLTPDHRYRIVAVKPGRFPLGTKLKLTHVNGGIIAVVRVADWGDLADDELDMFFDETNQRGAREWGNMKFNVTVVE